MSESKQAATPDFHELGERTQALRARLDELRGRL